MKAFASCLAALLVLALAGPAQAVSIDTVTIGNPGNAGEWSGESYGGYGPDRICGAVDYVYHIGKYEVTNSQYAEFLNAVATVGDPNSLYKANNGMGGGWNGVGGISRTGSGTAGAPFVYTARANRGNRPVNYVSWYDTLRFANWLHNGQPSGVQGPSTTEDGAYDMSMGSSAVRKPGALVFLPSEDEWYKAAYYKGGGTSAGYWDYPTQSDTAPTAELLPGTDMVNGSANYADNGYVDTTYYTTEVGAYNAKPSDSPYGTFDQGGNVWEWNEALLYGSYRGVRGGSTGHGAYSLLASDRSAYVPPFEDGFVGFRVASGISPPPGQPPEPPHTPQLYAVLVGSNDGPFHRGDLDAQAIRNVLSGYRGVAPENLTLLLNPSADNVHAAIGQISDKLQPGDSFVFFYAGHGAYLNGGSEPQCWNSPLAIALYQELWNDGDEMLVWDDKNGAATSIEDDNLKQWLSENPKMASAQKLVLLDACHSGGFWGREGNQSDVGDLDKLENIGLIAACQEQNFTFTYPWNGRGYFSTALENALALGGDGFAEADVDRNGVVSFEELQDTIQQFATFNQGDVGVIRRFSWDGQVIEAEIDALDLYAACGGGFDPGNSVFAIPEPSMFVLLGAGAVSLLAYVWRRRTRMA